ncbi:MAG: hypothetical protein DI630_31425 [Gordonia sp. (in: high G+C Gram-positive bacteria)]|nr:MAG: hypothetical protein DI630_31425 [Gordonia sp. (in: high G+C Gram-positive bacteria)]
MAQPPVHPLRPELGPDLMVRLVPSKTMPRAGHSLRPRGSDLLPGQSELEQEVAWVFPAMAAAPITARTLRQHLHQAYCFALGSLVHREILEQVPLRPDWEDFLPGVAQAVRETLFEAARTGVREALEVVANLEVNVDVFGPASLWQLRAYWWGLGREFVLGQLLLAEGDVTAWEQYRYQSVENLVEQEMSLGEERLSSLGAAYLEAAYDIVALWHAQPTLAHRAATAQRKERNQSLMRGTVATLSALSDASEAASRRRARDALTAQRRARASRMRRW